MLLQRAGSDVIPPPGFCPPPWESLAAAWDSAPMPPSDTVTLGPAVITIGHDDFEADDVDPEKTRNVVGHEFGWDNEYPKRETHVAKFRIAWRPVTNGQFYAFYEGGGKNKVELPATWIEEEGKIKVGKVILLSLLRDESVYRFARCMVQCLWRLHTIGPS
jgi:formylglycine-generating enzyme required for sulfatase activity